MSFQSDSETYAVRAMKPYTNDGDRQRGRNNQQDRECPDRGSRRLDVRRGRES